MVENFLNKTIKLKEDYGNLKSGKIGLCTADLSEESFGETILAVYFGEDSWITFKDKDMKSKFEIVKE